MSEFRAAKKAHEASDERYLLCLTVLGMVVG